MVAAGIPEITENHAKVLFIFAQDMLHILEEYNEAFDRNLQIRIGISSGPVVAGVIGKKKFIYDLWSDTVNMASRMEAYGQTGRIQVSQPTFDILKSEFDFEKIPDVLKTQQILRSEKIAKFSSFSIHNSLCLRQSGWDF